ncbi:OB-fold nucleic acid binding domain-containing protein [Streptomyces sp. NRRL F-525]|uniref:OB-fold nucleic acid binding domain-containing protein n=1 Tax=Streptomyces sp. NRRL F-525 TaxID=1463861 RepID=UPI00052539FF|nr:OB-fold nucleic acid binding domain-containing protein [Streptomyces sp. NRRL F-525]
MFMTTAAAIRFTPLDIIRTAAVVIRARGYYQPLSRQWEQAVPTVLDVEHILYGRGPVLNGDGALMARAASGLPAALPAAVLEWARTGTAEQGTYRANLARVARAAEATARDLPLLCYAPEVWQREQARQARKTQAAADAVLSRHQGEKGERLVRTVEVAVIVDQRPRTYGYHVQERRLIKLRDAEGNIYIWEARVKDVTTLPQQGARIEIRGKVKQHDTYRNATHGDTAQTYLSNCRWKQAS